ncbi:hypothetical protein FE782_08155 [Paenibacillus antri]|uniref:Uncharacterized protein n=1 Tax=Paenibacillus antri TaxID=2582848 RepID=A0A5R9GBY7_9BACL|nr:hemerythrin domain-containing protein [Paenibacillus antri]TLS52599.1 hypothetical protein FE782_08155 [Paenibacillus antri]
MPTRYSLLVFSRTFEPMVEEHDALKKRMRRLQHEVRADAAIADPIQLLRRTKDEFVDFMQDLASYAAWEEHAIFPVVLPNATHGPSTVTVLEHNVEISAHYFRTFLDMTRNEAAMEREAHAAEALSNMALTLQHIGKYFKLEEQLVFPVSERLMDTLAYNAQ